MGYASILVTVDPEPESRSRVKLAATLADEFGASLIGVAAERPDFAVFTADPGTGGPFVLPVLQDRCLDRMRQAEALFHEVAAGRSRLSWRADLDDPLSFLLAQAAAADLVVMGRRVPDTPAARFAIAPGEAVVNLGRPILIPPAEVDYLDASRIAIGWMNTREARRAVSDAMPFLERATRVVVCSIGDQGGPDEGEALIRGLQGRGIPAVSVQAPADGVGTAEALIDLASEHAAGLLVTGAYGHSRLHEWAFGGVTRDMLRGCPVCCLMSH